MPAEKNTKILRGKDNQSRDSRLNKIEPGDLKPPSTPSLNTKEAKSIEALVEREGIAKLDLANTELFIDPNLLTLIPEELAKKFYVIPLARYGNVLYLTMANPFDLVVLESIKFRTHLDTEVSFTPKEQIEQWLEKLYSPRADLEEELKDVYEIKVEEEREEVDTDVELLKVRAQDAPAIRYVNLTLLQAVQDRASDIHIEPQEKELRVRFRVDGILRHVASVPQKLQPGIISRIKILGSMDIAERRVPQDGRCKVKILGRSVDIRLSTLPTIYGEKVVMRILDKESRSLDLDELGFETEVLKRFKRVLNLPHGIILVTGPTGSGKTTTLYSALNYISSPEKNIITVEDPVEYRLQGINQIQARPQVGLTFAAGLRSILRQDPDIVMVGEIRDRETAEIAIRAALTGHLVLSTLHTNDAVSTIMRLLDMGIDRFLLCSSLCLAMAQRLVRRICPKCRIQYVPDEELLVRLKHEKVKLEEMTFYKGQGCNHCSGSGYRGRTAIYEFVFLNKKLKELILEGTDEEAIRQTATEMGMVPLFMHGVQKVKEGITTVEEVLRVTTES